ncbi:MAG: MerR family DNA-binding transcriptional regulator [Oligoflexales bacterium]
MSFFGREGYAFYTYRRTAFLLGVAISTLRKWDKEKTLESSYKTSGGYRRYDYQNILKFVGKKQQPLKRIRLWRRKLWLFSYEKNETISLKQRFNFKSV